MRYTNTFKKLWGGSGAGEWAGYSYNIGIGCSHNCRYCYACSYFVQEGFISGYAAWPLEKPNRNKINIQQKVDLRIMFPSSHDITPAYLDTYCRALYNILSADNNVLLVSKPHLECITHICNEFSGFKSQMEFRFTIGSTKPEVCTFWEPGAPSPEERMECLQYATTEGYQTSVSMEPMLEGKDEAIETFYSLLPLTNGTIWIGMMNDLTNRANQSEPEMVAAIERIQTMQSSDQIIELYRYLKPEPQVRWKDSIKNIVKYL